MICDVFRFQRRLQKIKQSNKVDGQSVARLIEEVEQSIATAQQRKQNLPKIIYPDILPIAQKSDLIKKTILENQVTILCGETGSG
ncbi:MAG: hypothetical protein KAT90_03435, partial [Gammaproteobacteria bacterium]|nr:hypothetical protein [Gammaproteobacteria bacterium]